MHYTVVLVCMLPNLSLLCITLMKSYYVVSIQSLVRREKYEQDYQETSHGQPCELIRVSMTNQSI